MSFQSGILEGNHCLQWPALKPEFSMGKSGIVVPRCNQNPLDLQWLARLSVSMQNRLFPGTLSLGFLQNVLLHVCHPGTMCPHWAHHIHFILTECYWGDGCECHKVTAHFHSNQNWRWEKSLVKSVSAFVETKGVSKSLPVSFCVSVWASWLPRQN